jgi:hypothetical protein
LKSHKLVVAYKRTDEPGDTPPNYVGTFSIDGFAAAVRQLPAGCRKQIH